MNQLISNVLGIRLSGGDLVIDPVLPATLDKLHFEFEIDSKPVTFVYHLTDGAERSIKINGELLAVSGVENPYRQGGFRISNVLLSKSLNKEKNTIEISI